MSRKMNLLLLLSALLSALTGVGSSVRGVEPATAVAARAIPQAAAIGTIARPQRLVPALPDRVAASWARVILATPPRPAAPLFLLRRRE